MQAPSDDSTVALSFQALIPLGLQTSGNALQQELLALAGAVYVRRWVDRRGSVRVSARLRISGRAEAAEHGAPRVRSPRADRSPLATYAQLQAPRARDVGLFRGLLACISTREYEAAAEAVPTAFGFSKSSVSRRFIQASATALQQFRSRHHDDQQ